LFLNQTNSPKFWLKGFDLVLAGDVTPAYFRFSHPMLKHPIRKAMDKRAATRTIREAPFTVNFNRPMTAPPVKVPMIPIGILMAPKKQNDKSLFKQNV
jgi:hypothetical protein